MWHIAYMCMYALLNVIWNAYICDDVVVYLNIFLFVFRRCIPLQWTFNVFCLHTTHGAYPGSPVTGLKTRYHAS